MGKSILEKVFAKHTDDPSKVIPGKTIWLDIDIRSARDFGGANVVKHLQREYPNERKIDDIAKTYFTFDCVSPANTIPYAENQQIARTFAREQNVALYDVGQGIGTHILIENGHIRPGMTAVGTDSHFNIMGAIGAFGQGMGDRDIAFAWKSGKVWFDVPSSVRINIDGIPTHPDVTSKDVVLALLQKFGASGLLGKAVEVYGDYIESIGLDERITIASMGTEMGLISLLIPPNEALVKELHDWSPGDFDTIVADTDARYEDEFTISVENLEPLTGAPFEPHNVHPISDFSGQHVDSVFVGSCTGGRITDLRMLADELENGIADGIILRVVPASRRTLAMAIEDGTYDRLFAAGATVSHPACGGCASGQIGMTGAGEVQVSTGNRNFKGKQGAGETFLASAKTAGKVAARGTL